MLGICALTQGRALQPCGLGRKQGFNADYEAKKLAHKGGWFFEVACAAAEAPSVFSGLIQCLGGDEWADFRTPLLQRRLLSKNGQLLLLLCQAPKRGLLPAHGQMVASIASQQTDKDESVGTSWRQLACSAQNIDTSAQICSCYAVSEARIRKGIDEGCQTVEALGQALKCGTNCGSCVPELKRLLQSSAQVQARSEGAVPAGGSG